MGEMIRLNSKVDDAEFGAYRAAPKGRRRGGVVVIQEIFGLDKWVREDVERWAALGFEAVAPSMFDRFEPGFVAGHDPDGFAEGRKYAQALTVETAIDDIQTCIDLLKKDGPVFLVGYCFGGSMAWQAAAKAHDLAAASSYYGGSIQANAGLTPRCPVILHLGRQDSHIPADAVKAAVQEANPGVPVYIYEAGGHGFNNEGGPGYDRDDAELARARTLDLFEQNGAL
jgi:carboxymethylenebutenolidase